MLNRVARRQATGQGLGRGGSKYREEGRQVVAVARDGRSTNPANDEKNEVLHAGMATAR